jgi:hypothetical protein
LDAWRVAMVIAHRRSSRPRSVSRSSLASVRGPDTPEAQTGISWSSLWRRPWAPSDDRVTRQPAAFHRAGLLLSLAEGTKRILRKSVGPPEVQEALSEKPCTVPWRHADEEKSQAGDRTWVPSVSGPPGYPKGMKLAAPVVSHLSPNGPFSRVVGARSEQSGSGLRRRRCVAGRRSGPVEPVRRPRWGAR